MATVITVPRDSSLQLRLVVGTNPSTGAPINAPTIAAITPAIISAGKNGHSTFARKGAIGFKKKFISLSSGDMVKIAEV